jgi:hypothetical protein
MAQNVIEVVGTSRESFAKAAKGLIDKPLRFRLPEAFSITEANEIQSETIAELAATRLSDSPHTSGLVQTIEQSVRKWDMPRMNSRARSCLKRPSLCGRCRLSLS